MAIRLHIQGLKKYHSYSVEDVTEAVDVTPRTNCSWGDRISHILKDQRPHMVLGYVLIDFIKPQKSKPASPHPLDEFYCLRCRTHKNPFGMMADSLLSPVWRCQVMRLKAIVKATKQERRNI
jgi:hypothetical protein